MELIQTQKIKILTFIDTPNFNNPNHQPRRIIQTNPKKDRNLNIKSFTIH